MCAPAAKNPGARLRTLPITHRKLSIYAASIHTTKNDGVVRSNERGLHELLWHDFQDALYTINEKSKVE